MVTKNFVQTAIAGLKVWIDHKLKRLEVTDSDALALCAESGLVDPVASKNGAVYTDKDGTIFCL